MLDFEPGYHDQRVDLRDGDTLKDVTYGRWYDNKKEGRYLVPGMLSGSDYSGTLVEQSNYKAFAREYADGEEVWWTNAPGGHGTYAIVIDLAAVPEDLEKSVTEFFNALESYPVIDEHLMSEMEMESQSEAWENWARSDFQKALEKEFDCDIDEVDDDKLYELFHTASDRANEYWVNEQGGDSWIDVEKVVKKGVTEADLDALGATFTNEKFAENGPGFYIVYGQRPRRSAEEVFESFKAAEDDAWAVYKNEQEYNTSKNPPSVAVIEARDRADAIEGRGHVWWVDGTTHGPATDPRQSELAFNRSKHR